MLTSAAAKVDSLAGRTFTIDRAANIHNPAFVAYLVDHAEHLFDISWMATARELPPEPISRSRWPHGP